jgi:hypothetical protein
MRLTKSLFQVIVVTLAFAVCWLPIHILELMKCGNLEFLIKQIQKYPNILYSIRAFTHALAYFNSCLNPYLYALLNRNFCIDLVDIIPAWRPCCKQTHLIENNRENSTVKYSPNQVSKRKRFQNYDEEESDFPESKQTTNDVSCQVELLGLKSNKYITSVHDQTKLI